MAAVMASPAAIVVFAALLVLGIDPVFSVLTGGGVWSVAVLWATTRSRRYRVASIDGDCLRIEPQQLGARKVPLLVADVSRLALCDLPALGFTVVVESRHGDEFLLAFGQGWREAKRRVEDLESIAGRRLRSVSSSHGEG